MSDVATLPAAAATPGKPEKRYRVSILFTGLARMWRGTGAALLVILVNALVQAALTYVNAQVGMNAAYIISLVVSGVVLIGSLAVLVSVALRAVDGRVGLKAALAGATSHLPLFALWVVVQWAVVVVVSLFVGPLGILLAVLTVFLPFAAADGHGNAIGANFSAFKDRWGRWLITTIIMLVIALVLFLLQAVNVFFIKGTPASFIGWLVLGILTWWMLTAWASLYRSTRVGHLADSA